MASVTRNDDGIRVRGKPPNLSAALPLTSSQVQAISVSLDTPSKSAIKHAFKSTQPLIRVTPESDAGISRLHLRLPRTTPPGTYSGTVKIEEHDQPIVIEVEPRKRISFSPKQTTICCKSGERIELCFTMINMGNVPLTIPKVSGFGLYQKQGMDHAVGAAFHKQLSEGERRIDSFMEALHDGYGGVVKLKIQEGAGILDPGDSREVTVVLQIPSQTVPGNEYWGLWSIYDYNYKIEIELLPDDKKKMKSKTP